MTASMLDSDTGLIFPPGSISSLAAERGHSWQDLVAAVEKTGPDSPEQMAFLLMMARLSSCANCNANSFAPFMAVRFVAGSPLSVFMGRTRI